MGVTLYTNLIWQNLLFPAFCSNPYIKKKKSAHWKRFRECNTKLIWVGDTDLMGKDLWGLNMYNMIGEVIGVQKGGRKRKTFMSIHTDTRGQLPTAWDSHVCSNDCWNEIQDRKLHQSARRNFQSETLSSDKTAVSTFDKKYTTQNRSTLQGAAYTA